jgi:N-acyl-D-amino-acid deacylase
VVRPFAAAACLAVLVPLLGVAQAPRYDIVIAGGLVVDGSGQPGRRADVGISRGRIASVGSIPRTAGRETIDAVGLVVAPGFIDVHTHADDILEHPMAENFVRMGVTSVIAGNCGTSALDVGEALAAIQRAGVSVNYATLIGHNSVRESVMGTADRLPTIGDMARMRSIVWRALADGALGFSTGLQYVPGAYAKAPEIIDLARIAANAGGVYATHMRNEGTAIEAALKESLQVGATTGARVQISHLKIDSPSRWGASGAALALLEEARGRGVQVMADQYAYTAASSSLSIRFPSWALEGDRAAVAARLSDPSEWTRIEAGMRRMLSDRGLQDLSFAVVASYGPDPSLQGLSMKQVAARLEGADDADAQFEAARTMLLRGGAAMVYHLMSDDDVDRIMRHSLVDIASDSGLPPDDASVPHPRTYGNTARVLGENVRKRRVLTLAAAVRKMTALPAEHFRLDRRGLLKEGYAADVTIFDPARIRDAATFERPRAFPEGIPFVLVNGVVVVRAREHTRARPGQVLTGGRSSASGVSPRGGRLAHLPDGAAGAAAAFAQSSSAR